MGTKRVVVVCDMQTGLLVGLDIASPARLGLPRMLGLSFEADLISGWQREGGSYDKEASEQTSPRAEYIGRLEAESWRVESVDSQG